MASPGPASLWAFRKTVDRFLETAFEQVFVALEGDGAGRFPLAGKQVRQVEAVDRVEKQQGADPLIEVVALASEGVERVRLGEQFREAHAVAGCVERLGCGRSRPAR